MRISQLEESGLLCCIKQFGLPPVKKLGQGMVFPLKRVLIGFETVAGAEDERFPFFPSSPVLVLGIHPLPEHPLVGAVGGKRTYLILYCASSSSKGSV